MKEAIIKYVKDCSDTLPLNGIIALSIVLFLLAIVVLVFFWRRNGSRWMATFLLIEYLVWITFLVLIFRTALPERMSILKPFWSHDPSLEGYNHLHPQVIMNVLVFIPVGVLMGCVFDRMKFWKTLLYGASFSILIEVLQYVTRRGYAEFDDVFHNTLGCLIGFVLYTVVARVIRLIITLARKKC